MIWVLFIVVGRAARRGVRRAARRAGSHYDPLSEADPTQAGPRAVRGLHAPTTMAAVHFDTALRGYRMDQVDAVLDQLQVRIAELEAGRDRPEV